MSLVCNHLSEVEHGCDTAVDFGWLRESSQSAGNRRSKQAFLIKVNLARYVEVTPKNQHTEELQGELQLTVYLWKFKPQRRLPPTVDEDH